MPDLQEIDARVEALLAALWRLTSEQDGICVSMLTSGVQTATGLDELEDLRNQTETLRRQLRALKNTSRLDPKVLEVDRKLDDALNRYYWLWQKCKDNLNEESH
ncbi:MAG: aspartyl-phosphate phosphatase Spo0E family protein [Negativicutes bacterium]|nr:aspartyl-phosphate phosphatase Spo0E family protein [Negativicutes bacterium]